MKKMVKRLLISVLALVVVMGMSTSVFAYTALDDDGCYGDKDLAYQNQNDTSMNVIYSSAGMLRINDEGTTAVVSKDGKNVNVTATTASSKTWGKITKIAFIEQTATDEEKNAAPSPVFENSDYSADAVSRVMTFSIPVEEVGKKIPVCRYTSSQDGTGKWEDFSAQPYYIVLHTDDLYQQLQAAYAAATDDVVKGNIQKAIDNAGYQVEKNNTMFKPEAAAIVKEGTSNILKLTMGSTSLTKVFMGPASEANDENAIDIDISDGAKGYVDIPFKSFNEPFVLAFKGSSSWSNRPVVIDPQSRKVTFLRSMTDAVISEIPAQSFTGDAIEPELTITYKDGKNIDTLTKDEDYELVYDGNVNAGTATVTVIGKGKYFGENTAEFTINPAAQKLTVSKAAKSVKAKALKKKAVFTSKVVVRGAKTKVTYVKVTKGSSKKLTINKKTGKIKVAKKTKKGTYKIKVKVTAAKTKNYKAASITKVIKVVVK